MTLNRLRIAHQLSLLIAATVVLAVLVVGGFSAFNLRSGFHDYLKARDEEQLTRLVALLERRATADPQWNWLRDEPDPLRSLMDEFLGRPPRGERRGLPGLPPPPRDERPPPSPGQGNMRERLILTDLQGNRLAGQAYAFSSRNVFVRAQEATAAGRPVVVSA